MLKIGRCNGFALYRYQLSQTCLRLLFLQQKRQQDLPRPSGAGDPFEKFLKEQSKRQAEWSSNQPPKKPKAADKKKEVAEDVVDLTKQLEEKSAECAALKKTGCRASTDQCFCC